MLKPMIHTVTANPALDLTYRVAEVKLDDTTRAREVLRAAGGKGINVSRVSARLGHPTVAIAFAGGHAGDEIRDLLKAEGVRTWFTRHDEPTRTNAIIQDDLGHQIRVSGPGARVDESEVAAFTNSIFDLRAPDFLVLSGSKLKGMPADFYAEASRRAMGEGVKVAVDADEMDLRRAVEAGVYIIKPNQHELARLLGRPVSGVEDAAQAARDIVGRGVEVVLASLGAMGAVLVTADSSWRATPPEVEVDSTVGAGDSMLAGALVALSEGRPRQESLKLAVACGTATATTPGTSLCHRELVDSLYPLVKVEALL